MSVSNGHPQRVVVEQGAKVRGGEGVQPSPRFRDRSRVQPGFISTRREVLVYFDSKVSNTFYLLYRLEREQLKPEYLKLNPQHTVPTLVDDGLSLSYLANKYGKGSTLYPEEPRARALVDQRLYFDIGTLYQRFADYFYPQIFGGAPADQGKLQKIEESLKFLDTFLEGQKYVAGPNLTLADLSLIASVSSFEATDIDFKKYSNVKRWYQTVKSTAPGYQEANEKGLEAFKGLVNSMMKK
ncbi:glutathione S-transferase 1-1-like [Cydia strobilella]|uniref:glutathione S-transferase 1-1-like n=1 Tax=Cydia strobilella TaxID=1100964 RepID=UPI0030050EE8